MEKRSAEAEFEHEIMKRVNAILKSRILSFLCRENRFAITSNSIGFRKEKSREDYFEDFFFI